MHTQTILTHAAAFLTAAIICVTSVCINSACGRNSLPQEATQAQHDATQETTVDTTSETDVCIATSKASAQTDPTHTAKPERTTLPRTCAPESTVTTRPPETSATETKAPMYGERSFTVIRADSLNDRSRDTASYPKAQIVSDRGTLGHLLDSHRNSSAQLPDDLKKVSSTCTESWFRTHRLILVELYENSVSYNHDFLRVVYTCDGVRVEYKRWVPHGSDGAVTMHPMIAYPTYCIVVDDATLSAQDNVTLRLVTDDQTDPDDDPAEEPDVTEPPQEDKEKEWENRYKMFFGDEPLGSDSEAFMEQCFADYDKLSAMNNLDNVLIVIAPSIEDDFGAVFTVAAPNHSYYLQYADEVQREAAYRKWTALVQEDKIVSVDHNYRIIHFC